jgi:hypothetical protein
MTRPSTLPIAVVLLAALLGHDAMARPKASEQPPRPVLPLRTATFADAVSPAVREAITLGLNEPGFEQAELSFVAVDLDSGELLAAHQSCQQCQNHYLGCGLVDLEAGVSFQNRVLPSR